jgi:hypothetical protein
VQDIDTISRNSGNGNHEQPAHARCDCHVKMERSAGLLLRATLE